MKINLIALTVVVVIAPLSTDQQTLAAPLPRYHLEVAEFHQGADYGLVTGFNNATHAAYIQHSFGTRSYWWNGNSAIQLPPASPSGQSVALDMNDDDTVVGLEVLFGTYRSAVIWEQGVPRSLGTLGGQESSAEAINDLGVVAGWSSVASGAKHLFTWDGAFTDHGQLPPSDTCCYDISTINNAGQVIGHSYGSLLRGWMYDNGQFVPLPDVAGGSDSNPNDLNNLGTVVGSSWVRQVTRLPVAWRSGQIQQLPLPVGAVGGEAVAINDGEQIVGAISIPRENENGNRPLATLWENGNVSPLSELVQNLGDWQLWQAEDINERGQILVFAYSETNSYRRVILTPVPEPGAMALLLTAIFTATGMNLRRQRSYPVN